MSKLQEKRAAAQDKILKAAKELGREFKLQIRTRLKVAIDSLDAIPDEYIRVGFEAVDVSAKLSECVEKILLMAKFNISLADFVAEPELEDDSDDSESVDLPEE